MAIDVGGIKTTFEGDATPLVSAFGAASAAAKQGSDAIKGALGGATGAADELSNRLNALRARQSELISALTTASDEVRKDTQLMNAYRDAVLSTQKQIDAMTGRQAAAERSTKNLAAAHAEVKQKLEGAAGSSVLFGTAINATAKRGTEEMARMVGTVNAFGGALGGLPPELQKVGGAVSQAFGAFAVGGVVGLAIAGTIAGIGTLIEKFDLFGARGEEAAKKVAEKMQAFADAAKNAADDAERALKALREGRSETTIKREEGLAAARGRLDQAMSSLERGPKASYVAPGAFSTVQGLDKMLATVGYSEQTRRGITNEEEARRYYEDAASKAKDLYGITGAAMATAAAALDEWRNLVREDEASKAIVAEQEKIKEQEFTEGAIDEEAAARNKKTVESYEKNLAAAVENDAKMREASAYIDQFSVAAYDAGVAGDAFVQALAAAYYALEKRGKIVEPEAREAEIAIPMLGGLVVPLRALAEEAHSEMVWRQLARAELAKETQARAEATHAMQSWDDKGFAMFGDALKSAFSIDRLEKGDLSQLGGEFDPEALVAGAGSAIGMAIGGPAGAAIGSEVGSKLLEVGKMLVDAVTLGIGNLIGKVLGGSERFRGAAGGWQSADSAGNVAMLAANLVPVVGPILGPLTKGAVQLSGALVGASMETQQFAKFQAVASFAFDKLTAGLGGIWLMMRPVAGAFFEVASAMAPVLTLFLNFIPFGIIIEVTIGAMVNLARAVLLVSQTMARFVDFVGDTLGFETDGLDAFIEETQKAWDDLDDINKGTGHFAFEDALKELADSVDDDVKATEENTATQERFMRDTRNIPLGRKELAGIEFGAAFGAAPWDRGGFSLHIEHFESRGNLNEDFDALQRLARAGTPTTVVGRSAVTRRN